MAVNSKEPRTDKRITAKQAASAAAEFLKDVTGYSGDVSVEEVELTPDGDWAVTLGHYDYWPAPEAKAPLSGLSKLLHTELLFKRFVVDGSTGDVRSMKMHEA